VNGTGEAYLKKAQQVTASVFLFFYVFFICAVANLKIWLPRME